MFYMLLYSVGSKVAYYNTKENMEFCLRLERIKFVLYISPVGTLKAMIVYTKSIFQQFFTIVTKTAISIVRTIRIILFCFCCMRYYTVPLDYDAVEEPKNFSCTI